MISQNPIFLLVTGDFNVKNNCITGEGNKIEPLTCSYGLRQLIFDPTNILHNSSWCIDLIFTNQSNFVIDSGVHPSLHPKCHHERLVWDYKNADSQSINKAIEMFNWEKLFQNKNIQNQLKLLNETVVNIVSNCQYCHSKQIYNL